MNIVLDHSLVDHQNIHYLEKKKNNIIDGIFTKIIYSDKWVTLNGLYIYFPIQNYTVERSINKNNLFFQTKTPSNHVLIKQITELENRIIEYYIQEHNLIKFGVNSLFNQLCSGKIKLYKENHNYYTNSKKSPVIVLKISGVWENSNDVGITYKFLEMM